MNLVNGILKFVQKNKVQSTAEPSKIQLLFFNDDGNSLLPEYFEESSTYFETFMSQGQICEHDCGDDSYSLLDIFAGKVAEAKSNSKSWSKDVMAGHVLNFFKCIGLISFSPFVVIVTPGDRKDYSSLGRYLCQIANDTAVREILRTQFDFFIPDDTLFMQACMDRERNRIHVSNASSLTRENQLSLNYFDKKAQWVMDKYLRHNSQGLDVDALSRKNVLYIVGRRSMTKGLYLSGDTFIQSYSFINDLNGSHLVKTLNSLSLLIEKRKASAKGKLFLIEQYPDFFKKVFVKFEVPSGLKLCRFAVIHPETKEIEFIVDESTRQDESRC